VASFEWIAPSTRRTTASTRGRTGRAGETGLAIALVTADTEAHFALIERRNRLTVPREVRAGFEPTEVAKPTLLAHGGVKGKRKSKKDKLREARAKAGNEPPRGA